MISAAAGLVAAEQNFNPFVVSIPSFCSDATLPATAELRGIIPLVDPAVAGSDRQNANSAASLTTPFDATGLSVAEVTAAQGFSSFTSVDASGNKGAAAADAATLSVKENVADKATNAAPAANDTAVGNVATGDALTALQTASDALGQAQIAVDGAIAGLGGDAANAAADTNAAADANAADNTADVNVAAVDATANSTAGATTSLDGADFGLCTPTMDFQLGRSGRGANQGTFLPTDPLVAKGQQDALNPNIITNRICDQLTNVCEANQAAKDACASAKTLVAGLSTKDQTTADAFNQALGF